MAKNSKTDKPLTQKQYALWKMTMYLGYKIFRCHQLSDRSFHYHDVQFPLCARCTGILFGFIIFGPIISIFTFGNMYVSIGLILLMCLDGLVQMFTKYKSNNIKRLITGIGFGYALFSFIVHIIIKIIYLLS